MRKPVDVIHGSVQSVANGLVPACPVNHTPHTIEMLLDTCESVCCSLHVSMRDAEAIGLLIRTAYALGRADGFRDAKAEQ